MLACVALTEALVGTHGVHQEHPDVGRSRKVLAVAVGAAFSYGVGDEGRKRLAQAAGG